jgi:glycosyltransferase involved in cell wall biosynthesis
VIYYDPRWSGPHGIGRFADEVIARLGPCTPLDPGVAKLSPLDPLATSLAVRGLRSGVYFSPGFNPPLACPIPLVFCIHDLIHLRFAGESTPLRRLYYRSVVRPASRKAFRVLTVSRHSRDTILEWSGLAPERVEIVGNGVGPAFSPDGGRREGPRPYFLHVGRREPHKNVLRLLQGYAASRCRRDVALVFTGAADHATVALIRRLGLERDVAFSGTLNDEELAAHYRGALGLAFPSLYEGFGIPVAEAMACGTPVLTSRATALAETAGEDNALFVDPQSSESIAQGLDRLAGDEALRKALRSRGLAQAPRFSWDAVAARVSAVLAAAAR